MTTALIFAGGAGRRMNSRSKPKQFLEMHGKPIIIYTLEHFEYHEEVDGIVIVCIREWMTELKGLIKRYGITKVMDIVPGGDTGHDSIHNGLASMGGLAEDDDIVMIHDGVRPLITKELAFYYGKIRGLYERACRDGIKTIDSSHLCSIYHEPMHMVKSTKNNIKITEPADFYIYRALYEALEGQQVFGI